jgi:hypothetical protein
VPFVSLKKNNEVTNRQIKARIIKKNRKSQTRKTGSFRNDELIQNRKLK